MSVSVLPDHIRHRLLATVDTLTFIDPDICDEVALVRYEAALTALGHALVDLAHGHPAATQQVAWPERPRRSGTTMARTAPQDAESGRPVTPSSWRRSWSGAGAQFREITAVLNAALDASAPVSADHLLHAATEATAVIRSALQAGAQSDAPDPGPNWEILRGFEDAMRRAHALLQPRTA